MSRKSRRHAEVNKAPDITLFGTNLDRLCNGHLTREVLIEREKAQSLLHGRNFDLPASAESTATPFVSKAGPIVAVLFNQICSCGNRVKAFGFLSRKITEKIIDGEVTRYARVADDTPERPSGFVWQDTYTPYCYSCIPDNVPKALQ